MQSILWRYGFSVLYRSLESCKGCLQVWMWKRNFTSLSCFSEQRTGQPQPDGQMSTSVRLDRGSPETASGEAGSQFLEGRQEKDCCSSCWGSVRSDCVFPHCFPSVRTAWKPVREDVEARGGWGWVCVCVCVCVCVVTDARPRPSLAHQTSDFKSTAASVMFHFF